MTFLPEAALKIGILSRKEVTNVLGNTIFQTGERCGVTRLTQPVHLGFGEILILVTDRDWCVDELNFRDTFGGLEYGRGQIGKAACFSGAKIKQAGN